MGLGRNAVAQKIKLSTIAESLGLSTATISLALRDSPLVASDTRDKIKEQARALGYIYNRRAASLHLALRHYRRGVPRCDEPVLW